MNANKTISTVPVEQQVAAQGAAQGAIGTTQVVGFHVADEAFGIDIMNVQEIILVGSITELPQVPPYVRGLINLRGLVIPVVDLRARFDLGVQAPTEDSRIIVLNVEERTLGIIVDQVDEVQRIRPEDIEAAPSGVGGSGRQFIAGLVKLDGRLLMLLDVDGILTEEDDMPEAPDDGAGGAGQLDS